MAMTNAIVLDGLRGRRERQLWKSYRRQHLEDLNSTWDSNFQSVLSRRNHELCGHYRGYFDTPSKELSNGDIRRDRSDRAFNNTLGSSATIGLCLYLPRRKYLGTDPNKLNDSKEMVGVYNTARAQTSQTLRAARKCRLGKTDVSHSCSRTVDWDPRHQMSPSAMNEGVHGHYRNWFDRPVLLEHGHPLSPRASHAKYHREKTLADTRTTKEIGRVCSTTGKPYKRKINEHNRVRLFQELSPLEHHNPLIATHKAQQEQTQKHTAESIKKALQASIEE